jgi:ferredoxin-NADP reductase
MTPYTELEIVAITDETNDTRSFVLRPTSGDPVHYKPGQFLTIVFPGRLNEERRSYSVASAEVLDEPPTITVKRIDNGTFSRYLFDVCKVGSKLYTIGASGFFTLPDDMDHLQCLVFFAAGSGITPILPLIKTVLYRVPHVRVTLVYSNRSIHDTIFYKDLQRLANTFPDRITVDYFFSDSKFLLKARLSKAIIAERLVQWSGGDTSHVAYYMCGPAAYMQMISITLLTEGVPASAIRREIFDREKPVVRHLPPDQDKHSVTVFLQGRDYAFETQYPDTILDSARKIGIFLPYSCEAGKCGTCTATCVSGTVWMSSNEVLSEREQRRGRVLTCTGYAVAGDVVLEFPDER